MLRTVPEDFRVEEQLGFEPEGQGEHAFLYLEKRELTTPELAEQLSTLSGVHPRDISFSGMKDRNAVTRQWFSVGLAGKPEPDWRGLEAGGQVRVLEATRHRRKLRRGVHRANRFAIRLRQLQGERAAIEQRLADIRAQGVPNYFGAQRFGRDGATLSQARSWMQRGGRISRNRQSIYLSCLRSLLFNQLLATRVAAGNWNRLCAGDVCMLAGSHSLFAVGQPDAELERRCAEADLHPALPLWGKGRDALAQAAAGYREQLAGESAVCGFLEQKGLQLDWRASRLMADDFCWQFCEDDSLLLTFELGAGGFATALIAGFAETVASGNERE
ncbi:tRNA pseudouridine(13) synthase TruD [Haliea sp. E17]